VLAEDAWASLSAGLHWMAIRDIPRIARVVQSADILRSLKGNRSATCVVAGRLQPPRHFGGQDLTLGTRRLGHEASNRDYEKEGPASPG